MVPALVATTKTADGTVGMVLDDRCPRRVARAEPAERRPGVQLRRRVRRVPRAAAAAAKPPTPAPRATRYDAAACAAARAVASALCEHLPEVAERRRWRRVRRLAKAGRAVRGAPALSPSLINCRRSSSAPLALGAGPLLEFGTGLPALRPWRGAFFQFSKNLLSNCVINRHVFPSFQGTVSVYNTKNYMAFVKGHRSLTTFYS